MNLRGNKILIEFIAMIQYIACSMWNKGVIIHKHDTKTNKVKKFSITEERGERLLQCENTEDHMKNSISTLISRYIY